MPDFGTDDEYEEDPDDAYYYDDVTGLREPEGISMIEITVISIEAVGNSEKAGLNSSTLMLQLRSKRNI
ncbi:hypothetical protein B7463_g10895, partial [Scytalidium lignicola]